MRVPREQVSAALFNLLANDPTLQSLCKTITRQPKIWTAVNEADKPCLILFKGGPATEGYIQPQQATIGLTKYQINYNLWLYLTSDPSGKIIAETTMNNVADAIDDALKGTKAVPTQFGERQTLGGLVNNAWLEGSSEWGREFEDNNITVFWRITVETGQ